MMSVRRRFFRVAAMTIPIAQSANPASNQNHAPTPFPLRPRESWYHIEANEALAVRGVATNAASARPLTHSGMTRWRRVSRQSNHVWPTIRATTNRTNSATRPPVGAAEPRRYRTGLTLLRTGNGGWVAAYKSTARSLRNMGRAIRQPKNRSATECKQRAISVDIKEFTRTRAWSLQASVTSNCQCSRKRGIAKAKSFAGVSVRVGRYRNDSSSSFRFRAVISRAISGGVAGGALVRRGT